MFELGSSFLGSVAASGVFLPWVVVLEWACKSCTGTNIGACLVGVLHLLPLDASALETPLACTTTAPTSVRLSQDPIFLSIFLF
jgi:hypothetical protein